MENMHNERSYFGTQNGSLVICHIGVVSIEQYEPVAQVYINNSGIYK